MARKQLSSWLFSPYDSVSTDAMHRRWLVFDEDEGYCRKICEQLLHVAPSHLKTAVFESADLTGKKRAKLLGNEFDIAVLFVHNEFRIGDLMALAGTVKRSGCFVLCCPPFCQWARTYTANYISHGYQLTHSPYIARFIDKINQATWIAQHNRRTTSLPNYNKLKVGGEHKKAIASDSTDRNFASVEQSHTYTALISQWTKESESASAIISAARGRGKSSLLGLFIATLCQQGMRICITSTLTENAERIFHHAEQSDDVTAVSATKLIHSQTNGSIEWVAPDNPILYDTAFDALIVDEAASFPIPTLLAILQRHKKWVLSTTTQGYEGSGQGFVNKLIPALQHSDTIHLTLEAPLRWYPGDLIEAFFNETCLFTSNTVQDLATPNGIRSTILNRSVVSNMTYRIVRFADLVEPEVVNVMALLTLAHYQTTPDDAMRLLDSPDTTLCIQTLKNVVTGVAVINNEGGAMLKSVDNAIAEGSRRPKGHLSAQRIALKTTLACDVTKRYWRINRIAIAPSLQGLGLGSTLLSEITAAAYNANVDAVTTSYGTTSTLDNFWLNNGFTIVDKGLKPNKASGETSALAIKPLSLQGNELTERLIAIQHIERERAPLSHYGPVTQGIILNKIHAFINGYRPLEVTWPYINILAKRANKAETTNVYNNLSTPLDSLDIDIKALEQAFNVQGKKAVTHCVKEKMKTLIAEPS
ncbi:GNAT family N-acetyltransferase [Alteromonas sp. A079]|uniref:GNAT family N-acetyltransferase n=1 Tax=Alteromonas sp. A079 TaxID=3410268 RepID=UPI003B9F1448